MKLKNGVKDPQAITSWCYLNWLNHSAKQTVCGAGMQTVCEFVGLLIFYFRESMLEQHGKPQVGKTFFVTHNDIAHGAVCVCTGEHWKQACTGERLNQRLTSPFHQSPVELAAQPNKDRGSKAWSGWSTVKRVWCEGTHTHIYFLIHTRPLLVQQVCACRKSLVFFFLKYPHL